MVSVLELKLDHDQNEFLFNLDEKFQNYDANAVGITRRDVISLASQIFDTQGFVSPYVMQYKKLLPMLWHRSSTNMIVRKLLHGNRRSRKRNMTIIVTKFLKKRPFFPIK